MRQAIQQDNILQLTVDGLQSKSFKVLNMYIYKAIDVSHLNRQVPSVALFSLSLIFRGIFYLTKQSIHFNLYLYISLKYHCRNNICFGKKFFLHSLKHCAILFLVAKGTVFSKRKFIYRGMEQLVARRAHNPKVIGSSPIPATMRTLEITSLEGFLLLCIRLT